MRLLVLGGTALVGGAVAPVVVRTSAELLSDAVGRYAYVSSRSVYASPVSDGLDETAPTVAGSAGAPSVGYAEDKRGGELAVDQSFDGRSLMARAGVILGPGENLGRLRCWLSHVDRAGVDRWTALPGWVPPGPAYAGLHTTDVGRAVTAGLRCRPVHETVADTLEWLHATGGLGYRPDRDGTDPLGLDEVTEAAALR